MDPKILRHRARMHLSGNWAVSVGVAAIACLLGGMMVGSMFFPKWEIQLQEYTFEALKNLNFNNFHMRLGSWNHVGLVAFILGGVVQLGYAQFLLMQQDGENPSFSILFSQFHRFGQGFAQRFLRDLYTCLWTFLLVIPGIVKGISYSMTPFILAEHPEMSAQDAIRMSMDLMDGHKMDYFWLCLTFFGWDLLAVLTLNIGYLLLNPYRNAAIAAFYRELTAATSETAEYI